MSKKRIKVMCIFGTRPEAIKMAPLIKCLSQNPSFDTKICVTAQHRQMLDQVLEKFEIVPDYDLNIMKQKQSLAGIVTGTLTELTEIFAKEKPDLCLVHGDTSTTFVGALGAFYEGIKTGHVEAGLRSFDKYQPFPEEINRRLTTNLADLHFAPTVEAKKNLLRENLSEEYIFVTGNTAIDCIGLTVKDDYIFEEEYLNSIDFSKKLITMTAHRRENWGEPLNNIFKAMLRIADDHPDVEIVYPVHLNPTVSTPAKQILGDHPRIHLINPIGVSDVHNLMSRSYLIVTDSGGLQEEAPALNKPVIVLRNVTERPEGLATGALTLAGTDTEKVYNTVNELLNNHDVYDKMAAAKNPFGDGQASQRIADAILYYFGINENKPDDWGLSR